MEASALTHTAHAPALIGRSPLLRLQSDEKLIALVRRGHHGAFEALVQRYQSRLLAFCRHMLSSNEDAEDVLQEVFAAAFNAMLADDRPIKARPWLYRIARNRCLNHLRRPSASGQDSMDVFERDGGTTTADTVHHREEFRQIVSDVQELPETQRTALLLREIDALSYDQIAEAMETTVPSVKSLLVRARVSLAEAAEARLLTCEEVREELGEVAEGLRRTSPPVRRHLRSCERCKVFRGELRSANRALTAVYPIGPLVILKKLFIAKLGAAGGTTAAGAGGAGAGAGGAASLASGAAVASSAGVSAATATATFSAGAGAVASKAVAGLAAAAIVTAGAVEVRHAEPERAPAPPAVAAVAGAPASAPLAAPSASAPVAADPIKPALAEVRPERTTPAAAAEKPATEPVVEATEEPPAPAPEAPPAAAPPAAPAPPVPAPGATTPTTEPKTGPVDERESTAEIPADRREEPPAEADPVARAPESNGGAPAPADPVGQAPAREERAKGQRPPADARRGSDQSGSSSRPTPAG